MRTTPPNSTHALQGSNHVLVSRRNTAAALRKRVRKLLNSGRWDEVHVHGLGAAVAMTTSLAAGLVQQGNGNWIASASISTELLVDRGVSKTGRLRNNSAIHISLLAGARSKMAPMVEQLRIASGGKMQLYIERALKILQVWLRATAPTNRCEASLLFVVGCSSTALCRGQRRLQGGVRRRDYSTPLAWTSFEYADRSRAADAGRRSGVWKVHWCSEAHGQYHTIFG